MSEKLYAFLLRLYPAHFRRAYGEDALQLFRDRLRDEPGIAGRLRLWLDVLTDVAFSAPREHRRAAVVAPVPAEVRLFQVLEMEPPRPATFFFGGALALASVAAFIMLLSYAGARKPFRRQDSSASQATSMQSAAASRSSTQLSAEGQARSTVPNASGTETQANGQPAEFMLDAAERQRVVAAVVASLRDYEDDGAAARHIVAALLRSERSGRFDAITSGRAFADALNTEMECESGHARAHFLHEHSVDPHFACEHDTPARRSLRDQHPGWPERTQTAHRDGKEERGAPELMQRGWKGPTDDAFARP